jgi:hypothetical protein
MSEGIQWIANTFGERARPRIAWHPDPFGQSTGTATMFADMCFEAHAWMRLAEETNKVSLFLYSQDE